MINKQLCVLIHIRNKGEFSTVKHVKPSCNFLGGASFVDHFCYFILCFVCLVCSLQPCGDPLGKG